MSPRSAKQLSEIRENSRSNILDSAFELFAKQGFHSTSITQIATKAGVAKGLIYNYFEKKEDLMYAIIYRGLTQTEAFMEDIMNASPGKARIRVMLDIAFRMLVQEYDYQKLMTSIGLQLSQFPDLEEIVTAKHKSMTPILAQELTASGHTAPLKHARLLSAALDGIAIQYLVVPDATPLEQFKQDLIDEYCT